MASRRKLQGTFFLVPLLALCLAALACGGGGSSSSPTTPGNTVTVQIMDDFFSPKEVSINAGDTVVWVKGGVAPLHTVTASDGSFDSGTSLTTAGATFSHTFNASGVTYLYYCKVHQACCMMQGSVKVGNGPPPNPGY
jgi:plastocyanin